MTPGLWLLRLAPLIEEKEDAEGGGNGDFTITALRLWCVWDIYLPVTMVNNLSIKDSGAQESNLSLDV